MTKIKMACPISKGPCIECAIYRGRHLYMCFKEYKGTPPGQDPDDFKGQYERDEDARDRKSGAPDV